ncbi:sigma-70 family RNA polymerase sigma factor [Flagellimonas taeanensis]|uniref:RNA polymerase sigma factor n=1 Tax=Flavobacteriaceae TaxID=49546 RepID=UPI000E6A88C2|nr:MULTISPECIES: sigma-70 family RNA polymerase sigma factor [Allomuricauda]MDC6384354.1 sigma-70 family RNA polymerase sigma factor [Muricauda sp. SK9]RIV49704.1 sigma-70 family RNA polymerase sigma factor [Allomuricauda taeanensis]RIV53903.1 sigma-70 family RNA polymerase sigma factor [Allomuricauda taeanensis]
MGKTDIIPNLFRSEYGKIVTVLSRYFGIEHIEIAEDLTSETFLMAVETWPYKGIPENPTAWLYTVAKNKAKNHLNRNKTFRDKILNELKTGEKPWDRLEIDLSHKSITDSQLQMLFTICHPSISQKSQISLALRVLCGFGIDEIADAFLTTKETITKRLQRAKEKLRLENIRMALPDDGQLQMRLDTVLRAMYLLFSEGYYSESNNSLIRKELCLEAMNLVYLLLQNDLTNNHSSNSLMSLMCFHASRLDARLSEKGEIILYQDQDASLWDKTLIEKGFHYLQQASKWEVVSKYYLEASIAYWHTVKQDHKEKWESILKLYDQLLTIDTTPVGAMNRLMALAKVKGNEQALKEAEKLNLEDNHFFYVLVSELHRETDREKALSALNKALELCKTEPEKILIKSKIQKM